MIYIETNSFNPEWNLACEEYFLKNSNEPILMLWQNKPTIVVGRFQNTLEEINENYVKENNISVIRRMTGGGAVYHDFGNLCYSFILRNIKVEEADFAIFAKPILKALAKFGVEAELSGRNDIVVDNKKISGTAMNLHEKSLLFHGTLLYSSELSILMKALKVNSLKMESKSEKSIKSRVTNIEPYIKMKNHSINDFKKRLKEELDNEFNISEYFIKDNELVEINKLANEKYKSKEWNIGNNPKSNLKNAIKFDGGLLEISMDIESGKINRCSIKGDFLGLSSIENVEKALENRRFERNEVKGILEKFDLKKHFGSIKLDEILKCMFGDEK